MLPGRITARPIGRVDRLWPRHLVVLAEHSSVISCVETRRSVQRRLPGWQRRRKVPVSIRWGVGTLGIRILAIMALTVWVIGHLGKCELLCCCLYAQLSSRAKRIFRQKRSHMANDSLVLSFDPHYCALSPVSYYVLHPLQAIDLRTVGHRVLAKSLSALPSTLDKS